MEPNDPVPPVIPIVAPCTAFATATIASPSTVSPRRAPPTPPSPRQSGSDPGKLPSTQEEPVSPVRTVTISDSMHRASRALLRSNRGPPDHIENFWAAMAGTAYPRSRQAGRNARTVRHLHSPLQAATDVRRPSGRRRIRYSHARAAAYQHLSSGVDLDCARSRLGSTCRDLPHSRPGDSSNALDSGGSIAFRVRTVHVVRRPAPTVVHQLSKGSEMVHLLRISITLRYCPVVLRPPARGDRLPPRLASG